MQTRSAYNIIAQHLYGLFLIESASAKKPDEHDINIARCKLVFEFILDACKDLRQT